MNKWLGSVWFCVLVDLTVIGAAQPAQAASQRWQGPLVQASGACLHQDSAALATLQRRAALGQYEDVVALASYWVCRSKPTEALPWLRKASDMGSGWASQVVARYLQAETPSATNTAAQIQYLTRSALQGSGWAARELAVLHLNGSIGLPANPGKASYWARYAEDVKEIVPNTFYLAESYAKGWGMPKNAAKAKVLYEQTMNTLHRAAKEGDPYADMLFYLAYSKGYGVQKDPEEALHWLQRAAAKGYPEAVEALKAASAEGKPHE